MIEKIKAGLEYVVGLYRTAPIGETMILINAGLITGIYDESFSIVFGVIGSLAGFSLTVQQFRLRKRLENSVSKHGYDNRAFKTTIHE